MLRIGGTGMLCYMQTNSRVAVKLQMDFLLGSDVRFKLCDLVDIVIYTIATSINVRITFREKNPVNFNEQWHQ